MPFPTPASPDNQAIRELRDSSKRLETLTEKLALSTELLSTSSKRVENLTEVLIIFTSLLALPILLEILGIDAKNFYGKLVIFVIFIFAFYVIFFNRKILIKISQKVQNLFKPKK